MSKQKSALIVGASRGLGLAIAAELLRRAWRVTGTVRDLSSPHVRELAARHPGAFQVEALDITDMPQLSALKQRLARESFDVLFVNAGVASDRDEAIGSVSAEHFSHVMVTNALSPMRVIEQFADNVPAGGTIGIMSSGQGSLADNEKGKYEVYRASKAALNMLMRSFAVRRGTDHALLLLAPGWVQTDMGGAGAKFTVDDVIPNIVDTLVAQEGRRGLRFLDRFGQTVRW